MTVRFFPLDDSKIANDIDWRDISANWVGTGVLKGYANGEGAVYADSSGMQVKVPPLQAMVDGVFYESDTEQLVPVPTRHATLDRYDRVVLRLDRTDNSCEVIVSPGTPGAGAPPALSSTPIEVDLPLAVLSVVSTASAGVGAATLAAGAVTIGRFWSGPRGSNTWTEIAQGSIAMNTAAGFTPTMQTNANNRYRYQVIGAVCNVQFSYNIEVSGVSGGSLGLQIKLPVKPKWERNTFSAVCQNVRTVGVSVLNGSDYYVDIRKLDGTALANQTSFWDFAGSYEIAQ
jgi:hypothetical protein